MSPLTWEDGGSFSLAYKSCSRPRPSPSFLSLTTEKWIHQASLKWQHSRVVCVSAHKGRLCHTEPCHLYRAFVFFFKEYLALNNICEYSLFPGSSFSTARPLLSPLLMKKISPFPLSRTLQRRVRHARSEEECRNVKKTKKQRLPCFCRRFATTTRSVFHFFLFFQWQRASHFPSVTITSSLLLCNSQKSPCFTARVQNITWMRLCKDDQGPFTNHFDYTVMHLITECIDAMQEFRATNLLSLSSVHIWNKLLHNLYPCFHKTLQAMAQRKISNK